MSGLCHARSAGNFNEYAFQGLDFVLDAADKAGIKLILVPSNLWKPNGGVPQFEQWCGAPFCMLYRPLSVLGAAASQPCCAVGAVSCRVTAEQASTNQRFYVRY